MASDILFSLVVLVLCSALQTVVCTLDENEVVAILTKQSEEMADLRKLVIGQAETIKEQGDRLMQLTKHCGGVQFLHEPERYKRILLKDPMVLSSRVAFTARLSQHITGIGNQQTIKFDNVVSNFGNSYSPVTGVFTAPANGTYFFTATIMAHSNQYLETEIVLNGNNVALMYTYGNQRFDQSSNSVVLGLKSGDKVWIRHVGQEGQMVYGGYWSSFSGFEI